MPEVSVIIPSYNHGHYLSHAVNSILAQTFSDWEVIVVDDGSTDNTREVAAQFTDLRIHYIYQKNQGLSAARNAGIHLARGDYIAFLDADDEWELGFLKRCYSVLQQDDSLGFVYSRTSFIDQDSNKLPRLGGRALTVEQFRNQILEGGFFPVHAALLRRQVLADVGDFDTNLTSLEDWDLWLRISERYPVCGINEPLARYRVYAGSMSTNAARMHANRIMVLTKCFGPPLGHPFDWPDDKRRGYAFANRASALGFIAQHEADEGWRYLLRATEIEPALLKRLDTFYELALGDQPRGFRGDPDRLDLATNGTDLLRRLDALFESVPPEVQGLRSAAYGNAYLALGMLYDQIGDWAQARWYLVRACLVYPVLLREYRFVRRLLKVLAGKRAVTAVQRRTNSNRVWQ